MKINLITVVLLILLSTASAFSQPTKPRFVHEPDLRKLLPKFLTPQGFLDPKYPEAVAKPSRYYTDLYGIHALADTTKDFIKRDFVPRFAEVTDEDENTVTLKFKEGFSCKFFPHSALKVMGVTVNFDHVEISGDTWQSLRKNIDAFKNLLEKSKLTKKYLRPNPHVKDEQLVFAQLTKRHNVMPKVAALSDLRNEKNSLLVYPESVHGNVKAYEKFKADVLDKETFDWVALEMLVPSQQRIWTFSLKRLKTPLNI
jgi:hypothetical protein